MKCIIQWPILFSVGSLNVLFAYPGTNIFGLTPLGQTVVYSMSIPPGKDTKKPWGILITQWSHSFHIISYSC